MTKHIGLLATATLLMGTSLTSFSGNISADEARALAAEFLSSKIGNAPETIRLNQVTPSSSTSTPLYYVFNTADNKGFVIISAETSATPVLGYSMDGAYPAAGVPEPMQWVMSGIERELKVAPAEQSSLSAAELRRSARKSGQRAVKKELATPAWSQEGPFNSMIPGQPLVGCVGTAMATVMKYHNFPESGTGSFGGVDFNVNYDWDSMRNDNYRSGYTQAEGDAVATLMYHASKSIDTQYAMSGSSAYEVRVPGALSTYFGYDPGVSYKKRADVATQQEWDNIVKAEIDANRPVIYCGQDVTAGHAFVCDGYEGEYLHFNWGWGGSANGYFLSTALNPTVSRTHHYNNLNTIIYNIKPGTGTINAWSPIHITADGNQVGMGSDLTDLSSGKTFTVRVGNLKNLSYDDFSGKIAVALYGSNGAMKTLLSTPANFNMQSMGYLYNGYMDLSGCKLPAAVTVADDDVIRLATQASGASEWLPVAGELPTINELAVNGAGAKTFAITLPTGVTGVSISGDPTVIPGWNYSFQVTPENALENVVTVKANGYVLTPGNNYTYVINNVREDQAVTVLVQNAADVVAKRSIWVETPGTLSTLISENEAGTIKDLTLFGSIDARDFAFMRDNMKLTRVDISGAYIAANGANQANALPREAFRGIGTLDEVVLPNSLNRINNGAFRQCGISKITIPANVKTYEYNVFVGDTRLRDIWVGRESAEFINWCVLSGVKVDLVTLHVPSDRAVTNYQKAENWNTIKNIVVDPIKATDDVLFAVMDNADVKYDSETLPGKMAKGSTVSFTASLIPDNDNRMEVYANSTLLTPDANGVYTTAINGNTIVHFNMVAPTAVESYKSQWTLTDANGSIGLISDVVNVLPGQEFTVRVNALNIPANYDQFYWAMALTDAAGNIKEFISPVNLWTAGPATNHKFNVTCCVKDAKVREGNTLRLVTSVNKRNWSLVTGAKADIVAALPALNNQTEVYNLKLNVEGNANISGLPETAVRGMDVTLKITPANAAHRVDLTIDGETIAQAATSVNHSFVVKADSEIDVKVFD
ncbi:MAG: C10 family peptidase, partial [Duncaniella sp.]|nr:C10 family peptidase [Duncaniella sp.]